MVRNPDPENQADPGETLLIRMKWANCVVPGRSPTARSFEGGIFIQLLSPQEETSSERLKEALFGENGPLEIFKNHVKEHDRRPADLARESLAMMRGAGQPGWSRLEDGPPRPGVRFEVAISYRGTGKGLVEALSKSLNAAGIEPYYYDEDE
ncbi:MAG: hypothetical protein J6386_19430 [Candidatus Synoicihabitans palmerolidicus]|nr:hypothetical protein [Candidatus Synoicihabitans palmerolidicus]